MVFDYQEFADDQDRDFRALLTNAQLWGAGLRVQGDFPMWDPRQLQMALLGRDINGDGQYSVRGVPVRIVEEGLNGAQEFTFITWNVSGQPARIDSADGTRTSFAY